MSLPQKSHACSSSQHFWCRKTMTRDIIYIVYTVCIYIYLFIYLFIKIHSPDPEVFVHVGVTKFSRLEKFPQNSKGKC